jgi:hypothetical protein
MSPTAHAEDGDDTVLTGSERDAFERLRSHDDPEVARIADHLIQSFRSREETN